MDTGSIMRIFILVIGLVVISALSCQIGKIDGKTVECNRSDCAYHANKLCGCKYLKLKYLGVSNTVCNSYIYKQPEETINFAKGVRNDETSSQAKALDERNA